METSHIDVQKVMLDVSFLLDSDVLQSQEDLISQYSDEFSFYVSKTFFNFITESAGDSSNNVKFLEILEFFGWKVADIRKIKTFLLQNRDSINTFEVAMAKLDSSKYAEKFGEFESTLSANISNPVLKDIILEEWAFVQTFSAIVAKKNKIAKFFEKYGVATLQFLKAAWEKILQKYDKIVKKLLRMPDTQTIRRVDRLRVLGKFVLIGMNHLFGEYVSTAFGAPVGILCDILLIIDP